MDIGTIWVGLLGSSWTEGMDCGYRFSLEAT